MCYNYIRIYMRYEGHVLRVVTERCTTIIRPTGDTVTGTFPKPFKHNLRLK